MLSEIVGCGNIVSSISFSVASNFIAKANAPALREIAQRLQEAIDRGLWHPRSNSARARVADLLPKD